MYPIGYGLLLQIFNLFLLPPTQSQFSTAIWKESAEHVIPGFLHFPISRSECSFPHSLPCLHYDSWSREDAQPWPGLARIHPPPTTGAAQASQGRVCKFPPAGGQQGQLEETGVCGVGHMKAIEYCTDLAGGDGIPYAMLKLSICLHTTKLHSNDLSTSSILLLFLFILGLPWLSVCSLVVAWVRLTVYLCPIWSLESPSFGCAWSPRFCRSFVECCTDT